MKPLKPLTEADLAFCKVVAGMRRMMNRARHTGNYFDMGESRNNDNEELGIIAEYAFCKHHNIWFDGTFGGADEGHDCVIKGNRIDIKAVDKPSLNLVAYKKPNPPDIFVLVLVEGVKSWIMGWAWKDQLCRPENVKDLGYGERYFMPKERLMKWPA